MFMTKEATLGLQGSLYISISTSSAACLYLLDRAIHLADLCTSDPNVSSITQVCAGRRQPNLRNSAMKEAAENGYLCVSL